MYIVPRIERRFTAMNTNFSPQNQIDDHAHAAITLTVTKKPSVTTDKVDRKLTSES